ncbi:hypothetical protein BKA67DRAFT_566206 [Truncatella angustata]|uniref:FAD-binding PCMH-type domain-containing protein n=1 Tax=Truncatella angustata TaxID=152316 RepID=A0A9P8ZY54_9PEZI|nr:uncharacterized protein BKA67DRAFT_566206 [Truncatella angustata]KAH6654783.1 hypothetical protein BKA67DRAFT_566206 [Truncatella angustata]
MATLDSLKLALRMEATTPSAKQALSDTQYNAGFNTLVQGSGWRTYQDFIIPQLSKLLTLFFDSPTNISVLEIGPGQESVLGHLPGPLRRKISRYVAFEPNLLFAARLEESLCLHPEADSPLPCLESPADIHRAPFVGDIKAANGTNTNTSDGGDNFDVILFCHSMYGMKPKRNFIEQALEKLVKLPKPGIVVVFHRDGSLHLDGLTCHQTSSFPTGMISVPDDDEILDSFASFIAGFVPKDAYVYKALKVEWRKICRALGCHVKAHPDRLLFSSPELVAVFTQHATALSRLTAQVPLVKGDRMVKSREARLHHPASTVRPTKVHHIQQCVLWALEHRVSLTIIGGGHSGHCLWPNVVSVDMSAFGQVYVSPAVEDGGESGSCPDSGMLVVAEAGCKTEDIVRKTMAAGVTVPLGARPSVGAGLWLQGGIGHLARLHGLACDSIIGAVIVSVETGQVLYFGCVPARHRPAGAVRPDNEADLLWAIRGAGTNFGIVISVTFKAYSALNFSVRNWVLPLMNESEVRHRLKDFDQLIAKELPRNCSADAYLYWDANQVHLGVTMFESSTSRRASETPMAVVEILGAEDNHNVVDSVGLFDTEMYISGMHGGHGGGKTSSFKRCLFLKSIGEKNVADRLVAAIETRPSPFCYLHLLQGGGAITDMAADTTAFGCRDWDFACVVTGVWPRDQDETEAARAAVQWVYNVAKNLLPVSTGAYSADLGPHPRDAALAAQAFGPNRPRLARLKHTLDPYNVLAYACPLPRPPMKQKLIILVTGESGVGKDYCASIWVTIFNTCSRANKEQHRPTLTAFFQDQVHQRPKLPEEHFLKLVHENVDVDVLFITGMRDDAPVATLSHLVPESRLLDVRVEVSGRAHWVRWGYNDGDDPGDKSKNSNINADGPNPCISHYRPSLIFDNNTTGKEAVEHFAEHCLLPFSHEDLQRLADMVRPIPDFPRPGIEFRHVLDICQQVGGLALCTSLLQTHFSGDWTKVQAIACCEAGGFIYASALALRVDVPLMLGREAGKLPRPTVSVAKSPSHISSSASPDSKEKRVEMNRNVIPRGGPVVIVDDVLATGKTLCAVLQLLVEAGVRARDMSIMVVAEFPVHRGRELLRRRGFGEVDLQSLLVFDGA